MSRHLTSSFAGTGGIIKSEPEDFRVEEIPLYAPCGEGEHLYIEVEKRGMTTFDLIARLARGLRVREREIGYAGLKDARATTRQTLSIPGVSPEQVAALEIEGARVLSAARHRNKLRPGHLSGNRFEIRVRRTEPGALERAKDILHVLRTVGVPNRFGIQRYGSLGNSHRIGGALLRGDFDEAARQIVGDPESIRNERWRMAAERFAAGDLEGALETLPPRYRNERNLLRRLVQGADSRQAVLALPRNLLRLYLSAYQSHLFDRIVEMRLDSLDILWPGDLAYKHANGACFRVEDPAAEQPRAERLEISPSGPLYGHKVDLAAGQAGILEESLLDKEGLSPGDFRLGGGLAMEGERRPLRVPLTEASVEEKGNGLRLAFRLPKGSYATSVLREVMKTESDPAI